MRALAGPRAPALVQSVRLLRDPYGFAAECARRFGTPFTWRVFTGGGGNPLPPPPPPGRRRSGGRKLVIVSGPDAVREIFTAPSSRLGGGNGRDAFPAFLGERSLLA